MPPGPFANKPFGPSPYGQSPYGQVPYGQVPYAPSAPAPRNTLAVVALVLGIPALLLSFIPLLGFLSVPFALVGIGIGIAGMRAKVVERAGGKGLAIGGLVTSIISILVSGAWLAVILVGAKDYHQAPRTAYVIGETTCSAPTTSAAAYSATITNRSKESWAFEVTVEFRSDTQSTGETVKTASLAPGESAPIRVTGKLSNSGEPPECVVSDVWFDGH